MATGLKNSKLTEKQKIWIKKKKLKFKQKLLKT